MLIYCSRLVLGSSPELAKQVICDWVSNKARERLSATRLTGVQSIRLRDGSKLTCESSEGDFPFLFATKYSHGDRTVSGRQWITEMGLSKDSPDSSLVCTVRVDTGEISARVSAPAQPSRPLVVTELVRRCAPRNETVGLSVGRIRANDARDFAYLSRDPSRTWPLVVISATPSAQYLVHPERLAGLLVGIAEVLVVDSDVPHGLLAETFDQESAPWGGAVSIVGAPRRGDHPLSLRFQKVLPSELADISLSGASTESEVFSLVTHRTNLPLSWRHISTEAVRTARLQSELERRKDRAAPDGQADPDYVPVLEQVNAEQVERIASLKADLEREQETREDLEDELRQRDYTISSLKLAISGSDEQRLDAPTARRDAFHEAVRSLVDGEPTPEQSLAIVEDLFGDRIVLLESAWSSAHDSAEFRYGRRLLNLLFLLCTEYWDGLRAGRPDNEARQCFGNAYAARESESVEKNKHAVELRTFVYQNAPVVMMQHLKIGVKDSIAETIRVHFLWQAQSQKIVIGHCGRHLDHK